MVNLTGLVAAIAVIVVLVAALGVLVKKLERQKKPGADMVSAGYTVRNEVLSPGERAFLPALREAVGLLAESRSLGIPMVLASVRLAEVLEVDKAAAAGNQSAWRSAFNRIGSKQVDFVVCHPETTRPLLVIELDDGSHGRADRKARDAVVDRACGSAGLPILHVRAAARYDVRGLAAEIGAVLPVRVATPHSA